MKTTPDIVSINHSELVNNWNEQYRNESAANALSSMLGTLPESLQTVLLERIEKLYPNSELVDPIINRLIGRLNKISN